MKKSIISEEKIKKFDDVHIKSMNLTGMVYAIKGNDVVVNTVRKGLVKAKLDDLKKIYTDSVNEAKAIGKKIFSDAKGKLFFGYQNDDDSVHLVDYKTWKKLSMKDLSNEFMANRLINTILKNERQFNKKVDYNMWSKKTNPSFEDRMDYFIKNGWISNITKAGIKEGVESVNEGAMSDIDIIANEAKDFKDFVKQFYAEYTNFPKNKESLKWLEDIYKGRTKMEGLERVAPALPQTEEEPVTEGDEKSPEEILMGLRQMAMGDLERIEDYAEMISDRMEQGQELSSWMYSQITLAVDQLNSVHDSMDGNDGIKESVNEIFGNDYLDNLAKDMVTNAVKTHKAKNFKDFMNVIKNHSLSSLHPSMIKIYKAAWEKYYKNESVNEAKSLDDMMKDANRIKKELADAQKEYSKSKTETNKAKVEAKKGQLERIANAIRNERANQRESVNEHKDCGCGCNGVTEGGCNTSLKEEKLNEWRAEEVLQQLGGRKFIAMTGAKNFVKNDKDKSITFKIGGGAKNSINYVKITLTSMDVYNVDFIKVRGTDIKTIATAKGVYNDKLQSIFTKYTGLYTSL
jgi:hypothetical protein